MSLSNFHFRNRIMQPEIEIEEISEYRSHNSPIKKVSIAGDSYIIFLDAEYINILPIISGTEEPHMGFKKIASTPYVNVKDTRIESMLTEGKQLIIFLITAEGLTLEYFVYKEGELSALTSLEVPPQAAAYTGGVGALGNLLFVPLLGNGFKAYLFNEETGVYEVVDVSAGMLKGVFGEEESQIVKVIVVKEDEGNEENTVTGAHELWLYTNSTPPALYQCAVALDGPNLSINLTEKITLKETMKDIFITPKSLFAPRQIVCFDSKHYKDVFRRIYKYIWNSTEKTWKEATETEMDLIELERAVFGTEYGGRVYTNLLQIYPMAQGYESPLTFSFPVKDLLYVNFLPREFGTDQYVIISTERHIYIKLIYIIPGYLEAGVEDLANEYEFTIRALSPQCQPKYRANDTLAHTACYMDQKFKLLVVEGEGGGEGSSGKEDNSHDNALKGTIIFLIIMIVIVLGICVFVGRRYSRANERYKALTLTQLTATIGEHIPPASDTGDVPVSNTADISDIQVNLPNQ